MRHARAGRKVPSATVLDCLLLQLQDALLFAARLLAARASSWGGGRASGGWL